MAAMKITLSGAMRARDVSRPRPEHLTAASAREATAARADAVSPRATPAPAGREGAKGVPGTRSPKGAEQEPRTRRRRRRVR